MDKETPRTKVRFGEPLWDTRVPEFRNFSSYDFLGKYTYFDETGVAKIWLAAVNDLNSPKNPLVISIYYNIFRSVGS